MPPTWFPVYCGVAALVLLLRAAIMAGDPDDVPGPASVIATAFLWPLAIALIVFAIAAALVLELIGGDEC